MTTERDTAVKDSETLRIIQDDDCPGCDWPEVVIVGTLKGGPTHWECAARPPCGWTKVLPA